MGLLIGLRRLHKFDCNVSSMATLKLLIKLCVFIQNVLSPSPVTINPSSPRQNGRHFADDIFKCIILNEKVRFGAKISQKFVRKTPNDNWVR